MDTSNGSSYARPAQPINPPTPYPIPDSLWPLHAPPADSSPPYVPASRGAWHNGWTRTTHVLPAAFPRKPTLRAPEGKTTFEDITRRRLEHYDGRWEKIYSRGEVLWTVSERFARATPSGSTSRPVTVVCVHANGMHKETFDETLDHLLTKGLPGGDVVNEVWTLDTVTQGEGGRVNAAELPDIFDWTENARDALNFLLAYLPHSSHAAPPPVLDRLSDSDIALRRSNGFVERKLVAVGHSQGGAAIALSACDAPALFDSIVFIDPVIVATTREDPSYDVRVAAAAKRRDVWPSRDEALSALSKSPFFQRWHPAVLRAYIEHGMYTSESSSPSGEVRLKCTPYQEASSFTERRAPVYAWHRLVALPPRVALFWVLAGGNENGVTGGDAGTPHTVWRRPANSANVRVEGAGHLIVQQKPEALARLVSEFLSEKYAGAGAMAKM